METPRWGKPGWLELVQVRLGYRFRNEELLNQAVTHRSYAHENPGHGLCDNERLEFLGDAVLNAVTSHLVMSRFPDKPEGELTRIRSSVVSKRALARVAREVGLGEFLLLGKGEDRTGGRGKASILADSYEAVVGAVYLDGGYQGAFEMLQAHLSGRLEAAGLKAGKQDFKTLLQEQSQRQQQTMPCYTLVSESGPDHDKRFRVSVSIGGVAMGQGEGKSKKEAEQQAAEQALKRLRAGPDPP
ncbi:MAG: ribonuclease III [Deltaproteobacteria bacterium]|nr:ribonuclease III [Deltaproteobacteria bacterium]